LCYCRFLDRGLPLMCEGASLIGQRADNAVNVAGYNNGRRRAKLGGSSAGASVQPADTDPLSSERGNGLGRRHHREYQPVGSAIPSSAAPERRHIGRYVFCSAGRNDGRDPRRGQLPWPHRSYPAGPRRSGRSGGDDFELSLWARQRQTWPVTVGPARRLDSPGLPLASLVVRLKCAGCETGADRTPSPPRFKAAAFSCGRAKARQDKR